MELAAAYLRARLGRALGYPPHRSTLQGLLADLAIEDAAQLRTWTKAQSRRRLANYYRDIEARQVAEREAGMKQHHPVPYGPPAA